MALRIEVMLDVVAIIEGDGIVRASHTIVGHTVGAARIVWVYKYVLAPAPRGQGEFSDKQIAVSDHLENFGHCNSTKSRAGLYT